MNEDAKYGVVRDYEPTNIPKQVWKATQVRVCLVENTETKEYESVDIVIAKVDGKALPYPICMPLDTATDMKDFIEELIRYYNKVWKGADPIDPKVELPPR